MKNAAQIALLILTVLILTSCRGMGNTPFTSDAPKEMPVTDIASVDTSTFIGEEKAKEIALEKAGLTSEGTIFDRVELDNDDGIWQYEVEFSKDGLEYDADIKADDGLVLSWETDSID